MRFYRHTLNRSKPISYTAACQSCTVSSQQISTEMRAFGRSMYTQLLHTGHFCHIKWWGISPSAAPSSSVAPPVFCPFQNGRLTYSESTTEWTDTINKFAFRIISSVSSSHLSFYALIDRLSPLPVKFAVRNAQFNVPYLRSWIKYVRVQTGVGFVFKTWWRQAGGESSGLFKNMER